MRCEWKSATSKALEWICTLKGCAVIKSDPGSPIYSQHLIKVNGSLLIINHINYTKKNYYWFWFDELCPLSLDLA